MRFTITLLPIPSTNTYKLPLSHIRYYLQPQQFLSVPSLSAARSSHPGLPRFRIQACQRRENHKITLIYMLACQWRGDGDSGRARESEIACRSSSSGWRACRSSSSGWRACRSSSSGWRACRPASSGWRACRSSSSALGDRRAMPPLASCVALAVASTIAGYGLLASLRTRGGLPALAGAKVRAEAEMAFSALLRPFTLFRGPIVFRTKYELMLGLIVRNVTKAKYDFGRTRERVNISNLSVYVEPDFTVSRLIN